MALVAAIDVDHEQLDRMGYFGTGDEGFKPNCSSIWRPGGAAWCVRIKGDLLDGAGGEFHDVQVGGGVVVIGSEGDPGSVR